MKEKEKSMERWRKDKQRTRADVKAFDRAYSSWVEDKRCYPKRARIMNRRDTAQEVEEF